MYQVGVEAVELDVDHLGREWGREERSEKRLLGEAFVSPARKENRSQAEVVL